MEDHTTKRCTKCNEEYPLIPEFWYADKRHKDGLASHCKACHNKAGRIRYAANPEQAKEAYIRRKTDDPEKIKEQKRRWIRNNTEAHRANSRNYYSNNLERARESNRRYQQENPDKVRGRDHRRRALEVSAEGSFTEAEIVTLYEQQRGLCFHCGCALAETGYHIGHWIPLSRGGTNWISNIRLLCPFDNLSQGNKLPHEWCPEKYAPLS